MNPPAFAQYAVDPDRLQQTLPEGCGVYLFKDASGRILYVGKAKNLRKRLVSYLRPRSDLPYKTALMMRKATGLDFILTATENEAFILESNLVRKHMPRYNIVLRDDKRFPSIRLDLNEPYPRLTIARKIKKDGALYFGPFSSAGAVRSTLKTIDRVFQVRKCKGRGLPKRTRPCLNHQMGRCLGACAGQVSVSEYGRVIEQVRLFLEGKNRELMARLNHEMGDAAERLDFEKAARIRDQMKAVKKIIERQHVVSPRLEDLDILGLAQDGEVSQIVVLFIRRGALVGSRDFLLKNSGDSPAEVMEAFLKQYYHREAFIPRQILTSETIEDRVSITQWLCESAGKRVQIHRPSRGEKRRLVKMATANAENLLVNRRGPQRGDLMEKVRESLNLRRTPGTIEGMDISNLQGGMAVGASVAFVDGIPQRAGYRNYKIRAVNGIDDYGMMAELVQRRVAKGALPDLLLIDGGKGHLSSVMRALARDPAAAGMDVAAIAKADAGLREEGDKIYIPGRKNSLNLKPDHPVLLLMMRIRDEAHRRAIMYHRRLRKKGLTASQLDRIPGVGEKRKHILLRHFEDVYAIAGAEVESLAAIPGISRSVAESIVRFFEGRDAKNRGDF